MNERDLFVAALEIENPQDREAFLDRACAGDPPLRERIEALLRAHQKGNSFLDLPPVAGLAATSDVPISEAPGTVVGPYKLLQQIGEGGMGVVYMAEQSEPVERRVALKIIKPGMDTRQVIARFDAERHALAMMDHPNIARVLDAGTTGEGAGEKGSGFGVQGSEPGLHPSSFIPHPSSFTSGRPYFVMELVKGIPITQYCDEHHLTPRHRLELFISVCHAVQHAHQKGIIHRDIKPSNILVAEYDDRPVPKIIDFGVAKAIQQRLTEKSVFTQLGQVVGTIDYMSPEQAKLNQLDIDTRSDIYSLGVMLYELLTGETPLDRQRLHSAAFDEMLRIIREEEPPRPSHRLSSSHSLPSIAANRQIEPKKLSTLVRGELDWIVMKALEKDRNRRYETASGFAADIERYLADQPVLACPPSGTYRLRKFARRNKASLAVVGVVLFSLILLGGGLGWVLRDREARREGTTRQARESLTRARLWARKNKLSLAREELATADARMGEDRAALARLVEDVEALEAELDRYQRFLDLVEQGHEAEFPQPVGMAMASGTGGGSAPQSQANSFLRDPAMAVPYLLEALSCYDILERNDWSARLEGGLLEPDQVAKIRRTAYEELLWLADDLSRRSVDHHSGRKVARQDAAREGLAYLRRAEGAGPPTTAFYQVRGRILKSLGKQAEARQDEELARRTPATIALDFDLLATAALDAKDKAGAVKQCEAALRVEPTHYWSLLRLGDCLVDLGQQEQDYALAAAIFTGCILHRPDHAQPYEGRGRAYANLNRWKEAEADFRQAVRLRPDFPEAHINLSWVLTVLGRGGDAEAEARDALRLRPDFRGAHMQLSVVLWTLGKHAEAEAEAREALRLDPDHLMSHDNLSGVLAELGKYVEAEAEAQEALRLRPDNPVAHVNLSWVLVALRKYPEAEAEAREALRLWPEDPTAHLNLGVCLDRQGRHREAEAEARQALRLRPGYPAARVNLGDALRGEGKYPEAEAEYRGILRLHPDAHLAYKAHNGLGVMRYQQGRYADAETEFRQAVSLRPDGATAHFNLGNALFVEKRYPEAEAEYRQALERQPDYPGVHAQLASALSEQGKNAEAAAERQAALRPRRGDFSAQSPQRLPGARVLAKESWRASFSPDGRRIVCGRMPQDSGLRIVDLSTGVATDLLPYGKDPAWSPGDGRRIAFVRVRGGQEEVWLVDADGRNPRKLAQGGFPNWSPDSKSVYFQSRQKGKLEVISADAEGAKATDVADLSFWYPAVSPDGKQFAYRRGSQLVIADLKTGKTLRTFPIYGGNGFGAGWSPDGKQLGYGGWGVGDPLGFYIIDLKAGRTSRLAGAGPTMPVWSPDGSKMVFDVRTRSGWSIWIVDTKALQTLTGQADNSSHKSAQAKVDPKRPEPLMAAGKPADAAKASKAKPAPSGEKRKK